MELIQFKRRGASDGDNSNDDTNNNRDVINRRIGKWRASKITRR